MQLAKILPVRAELVPWAAGMALLMASLANFLNRNDYAFLRTDVAIVGLVFAIASGAMALLYAGQQRLGRSILEGLLAYVFVDLNSEMTWLALTTGGGVAAVTYWRRLSLLGPMALLGTVVFITTLTGIQGKWTWIRSVPGTDTSPRAPADRALLHIIVDEHVGLEGLPLLGPEGIQLRDDLKAAYVQAGFTVFGRAYSQHMHTVNAIPQILNYGEDRGAAHSFSGVDIGSTKHLEKLSKSGYAVKVFQSDFANICSGTRFARCTTYDSFSLRPLLNAPLSTAERSKLILLKFLKLSALSPPIVIMWNASAEAVRKTGVNAPGIGLNNLALTSSVVSFEALDELNKQLAAARPGDAFVVHLLMPHSPYVLARDCALLPRSQWDWRKSPSRLRTRQLAYMEQVRCVTSEVMKSVDIFRASPAGTNGAVIIHGDHGSRLTRIDPQAGTVGLFTDPDMIAAFSTLVAVRPPHGQGNYVEAAQPVAQLVRAFSNSDFQTAPQVARSASGAVFLDDANWQPRARSRLPSAWLNPTLRESEMAVRY